MEKYVCTILVFFFIFSCSGPDQTKEEPINFPNAGVFVDYQWATEPESYKVRKERLKMFLKAHDTGDGTWEDSVHVRYVRYAKYDLLQCHYHLGELEEADRLLNEMMLSDRDIK
jgi:pentatricopeptide repeat protein